MFKQSEKTIKWKKEDHLRTVLLFALHTALIFALFVFSAFLDVEYDFKKMTSIVFSSENIEITVYIAIALVLAITGVYFYFYSEHRDFVYKAKNVNLLFIILETSILTMSFVGHYIGVYARPFALCALLCLLLINRRTAIFMNTVICILMFMADVFVANSFMGENIRSYSALIICYTTSLFAIYLVYGLRSRLWVFVMSFPIAVPVTISCICLEFEEFLIYPVNYILYGATSGILSVVIMMSLLPLFEKIFGVVTDYRLAEITDHKSTLIAKLIQKAPGTFNHSLVVSTLAESCANAIGENAVLARACAYYHDIGKLKCPEFFTENQQGYNPHNEISPELSTDIIRSHAKDGYDLILKYHLPQILADVAIQHHGTLPIRYFYMKALKFTEGDLDIANFSYPGPKPQSKIAAIIMIADGAEAKVRTLSDRSHAKVDQAVREIIEERMNFDQFSECELTMKDIDIIRATITNSLAGVYHDRVKYPKLKFGKSSGEE